ncbi:uncharacterized protein LOC126690557 isoform X2 [Quercus robur]|uniref:uncharacterized protein LOC126690557 isoform X2 n=1 Tax=Quercus robur TaxID=38942 RepID=UPI002162D054|nr:uncharacterized protein LOC126690557 isoform X2 [Quercus robur]
MIVKARDKPILSMLERIRVRLMSRLYIKRIGIEKYGAKLCPSIQDKLEKLKLESKRICAMPSRRFVYKVDNERERHVVDLVGRTCSCRAWDLTRIPCKLRVATIFVNHEKLEDYTHPCYYNNAFVETYKTPIPLMPGQSQWMSSGQPKLVAPTIYKPPGRPPMKRKRDANEPRNPYKVFRANKRVRCGRCQKEGHNAKGCKANVTGETAWERRQRLHKGKSWKAFYMQTMIPGPIFITGPIYFLSPFLILTLNIISAPTNTSALHYGLIFIQPGNRVTATSSTTTSSDSMLTEPKSVVLFRLQVHS